MSKKKSWWENVNDTMESTLGKDFGVYKSPDSVDPDNHYYGNNPEILKRGKWTGRNPDGSKDHGHYNRKNGYHRNQYDKELAREQERKDKNGYSAQKTIRGMLSALAGKKKD